MGQCPATTTAAAKFSNHLAKSVPTLRLFHARGAEVWCLGVRSSGPPGDQFITDESYLHIEEIPP